MKNNLDWNMTWMITWLFLQMTSIWEPWKKGLNIFNSRLVLADSQSATDDDFFVLNLLPMNIFHNWTGNRVTLKNWFQFKFERRFDSFSRSKFSSDMSSRAMIRIENVNGLRMAQFSEDAGPNAHPFDLIAV